MTARVVGTGPCWTLTHEVDRQDVTEWLPHYETELAALQALAIEWNEERDSWLEFPMEGRTFESEYSYLFESKAEACKDACVELICDGCDQAIGQEEMVDAGSGSHIDPAQIDFWIQEWSWTVDPDTGKDYCEDCPPPPESEEDARRRPGPNDVPMFEVGESS